MKNIIKTFTFVGTFLVSALLTHASVALMRWVPFGELDVATLLFDYTIGLFACGILAFLNDRRE